MDVERPGWKPRSGVGIKSIGEEEGDDHVADAVQAIVMNELHWDLAVPRHKVKVEVENGWVTMSGIVDRLNQRSCAGSDARRVPGVVGVINEIRFTPA
jgi:osmotically-inducible protein OsmY